MKEALPATESSLIKEIAVDYRNLVLNACNNDQDVVLYNSNVLHALFISKLLIERAKNSIKIFSGTLPEAFFDKSLLKGVIEKKLDENKELDITIIVEKYEKTPKWLSERDIPLRKLNKEVDIRNHMLLVDDASFRIEDEHDIDLCSKGGCDVKAIANFNDEDAAKKLNKTYDEILMPSSELVDISR